MKAEYSPVSVTEASLRAVRFATHQALLPKSKKQAYTGVGESQSPFRTRGLDFQEIRAYQPGDDMRQIDWRTTAKHGKPFTKLYTDEKECPVYFVCDMRGRMKFASHGDFKSVIAARMAMFLAFLVEQKKDRIGSVILMPDRVISADLRQNGGTEALITDLVSGGTSQPDTPDKTTLAQALTFLAREAKNGAMIFIFSDFSDLDDKAVHILNRLSTRRTIALIHIYDALEAKLPDGLWTVTDGWQTKTLDMTSKSARKAFEQAFKHQLSFIRETVDRYGWGYLQVKTTDNYLNTLTEYTRGGGF